jgi:hypothetical protein
MALLPAIPDFESKKKQVTDVFIRNNTMFIASDYVFRHINPKIILAEINVILNYLETTGDLQSKMVGSIKKFQRKI